MITMQQEFAEVREVPALEMNGVSWHAGQHKVLSDVSLAVKPGELLGLIGPNGSGKSSVLRILAGIHAPTQGTVHLQGHSLRTMGRRQVAQHLDLMASQTDFFCRLAQGPIGDRGIFRIQPAARKGNLARVVAQPVAAHCQQHTQPLRGR